MSSRIKDRHLFGAGAAACAVCCAPPVLALLGIAGAGATVATIAFAGLTFGLVVLAASLLGLWARSRRAGATSCSESGPVDLAITAPPPDARQENRSRRAGRMPRWRP
jgi:hypothetical protein